MPDWIAKDARLISDNLEKYALTGDTEALARARLECLELYKKEAIDKTISPQDFRELQTDIFQNIKYDIYDSKNKGLMNGIGVQAFISQEENAIKNNQSHLSTDTDTLLEANPDLPFASLSDADKQKAASDAILRNGFGLLELGADPNVSATLMNGAWTVNDHQYGLNFQMNAMSANSDFVIGADNQITELPILPASMNTSAQNIAQAARDSFKSWYQQTEGLREKEYAREQYLSAVMALSSINTPESRAELALFKKAIVSDLTALGETDGQALAQFGIIDIVNDDGSINQPNMMKAFQLISQDSEEVKP